tara:strand:- start:40 stop:534 length:495 start_codon:yes stop_codon:yes gene_type:complete
MIVNDNIELIHGNLLDFPNDVDFIAHSCNTQNIMGGGIAKQIKDRYPMAYEADLHAMHEDEVGLGSYSFAWTDATQSKGIYNMYTQDEIGAKRSVNYEGFYCALNKVADHIEWQSKHECEEKVLGLPYGISSGLAGGSSRVIGSMIHDILVDRSFKTYIVVYHE